MGYWTKSRLIFNSFRDHAQASIRQVARQTGLSKSSVHRLGQAMARRNQHPAEFSHEI
jgi:DNA-binding IclR family transcriptional regulator